MFPTVASTVTGVLDRRFLRNSFALSLAFLALSVVVALAGAGKLGSATADWQRWQASTQLLVGVGFIATVWVVAAVVQSQTRTITQTFEGYWGRPLTSLRRYREQRHSERLAALRSLGQVTEIYARYPLSRKQVMATRLGNILRAAERYPHDRYGADAVLVWPRLYPLLPDNVVASLGQAREALEFLLVLSAFSAAFGVLSVVYLLVMLGPVWLLLLCLFGSAAVAVTACRSSLGAALLYAEVLRSTFDLYRLNVFGFVQLPMPTDAAAERERWGELNRLILRNEPPPHPYSVVPQVQARD